MLAAIKDKVELLTFETRDQLVEHAVTKMIAAIAKSVSDRHKFVLAVSGGSSPKPLFHALASQPGIPWDQGIITLVDERFVPADNDDSNEKLVRETLLTDRAREAKFLGLYAPERSLEDRVTELNDHPALQTIDIAVLGMGMDGHTASLFPCSPELENNLATSQRYVKATPRAAPHQRISLSARAICEVPELWLFLPGNEKLERLQKILDGDDPASPVLPILKNRRLPLKVFSSP